tara:strand:+ start:1777 stop:1917 length:141 start_codon:yes stop_codon:yes gene_type:complete
VDLLNVIVKLQKDHVKEVLKVHENVVGLKEIPKVKIKEIARLIVEE